MWDSNHLESSLESDQPRWIWDRFNPVCIYHDIIEFWLETRLFHFTITEKSRSYTTEKEKVNSEGSGRVEMGWAEKGNKAYYTDVTLLKQIDPLCSLVVMTTISAIKGVSD